MIRRGPAPVDYFTIVPNSYLRDSQLSWGARGLLSWLMSHMAGYEVTEEGLISAGPMRRDGVRALVRELEKHGYLKRERTPILTGGSAVDYVLTDPRGTDKPSLGADGSAVPRSDQGEETPAAAGTAGQAHSQPTDGKSVPRSSVEDQKKTKTPSESSRATRLPEDFIPTPEMREWFAEEKLHLVLDARIEHEKFVNYWVGCPGAKGRKLDWCRTWKNWMWTAAERAPRRPGNALVPTSGVGGPVYRSTTDTKVQQTLNLAEKYRLMEESQ